MNQWIIEKYKMIMLGKEIYEMTQHIKMVKQRLELHKKRSEIYFSLSTCNFCLARIAHMRNLGNQRQNELINQVQKSVDLLEIELDKVSAELGD